MEKIGTLLREENKRICGIAGIIHRDGTAIIGNEMTKMLQALRHRGSDSTGFALYGRPQSDRHVIRFKVAEQEDQRSGFEIHHQIKERRVAVDERLRSMGAEIVGVTEATEHAFRYEIEYGDDLRRLVDYMEDREGVEILSLGHALELVKDLGDANRVSSQYQLAVFSGTHGIGHVRMATESDVDIRSAHPYWAYPFDDVSVVHNGQLTNYWLYRRALERRDHRFVSDCDSELIAVYIADQIDRGDDLKIAMDRSINKLDGVFTYVVATSDRLGMAKDVMAAKPMVLYERDNLVVLASEEVAIRSVIQEEITTFDAYEGDVRV